MYPCFKSSTTIPGVVLTNFFEHSKQVKGFTVASHKAMYMDVTHGCVT